MRVQVDLLGWTLEVSLGLTSELDEEDDSTGRLGTSEHSSVGFQPDPAFIDKYPWEEE
jgi:hypothetical protein